MPTTTTPPQATVVITTKNRREDVGVAIASALRQSVPIEVIVIDDGSTDDTSAHVRKEFPSVRLFTHSTSAGLIQRRNEGVAAATAPIVFSIDDDAEFSTEHVVAQTLADFDHPRIAAVAIPFSDVNKGPEIYQRATHPTEHEIIGSFIGTAHALRRDVFLALTGYRPRLIHQGEERDYCLRMLSHGYVVRRGRADIIKHYESPRRDLTRMTLFGRRNDILYGWCNVPLPALMVFWPANIVNSLGHAIGKRSVGCNLRGILNGFLAIPDFWHDRRPVSTETFWLYRRIGAPTHSKLSQVEHLLAEPPAAPNHT